MEPPPSPNPEPPQLLSVPNQQQHQQQQQQNHHHQRPQSPVSKRRKVEQRVVVTVRVDESSGKHRPDGSSPPSDLWSWRKYGQKPIKGSPYPRGYYRCSTSKGCSAKKQVERCRTDASLLVITYTSTHNHEGPHLHQITSSPPPQPPPPAAPMEYKALDSMERGEEVDSPASPDPGHNCHCAAGSNTSRASCCASAAGHGVSDNCNTVVASGPNMNDDGGDGGPAVAGPELHQVSGSSVGEAEGKLLDGCNIEDESARQSPPSSSHDREGEYQVTCSATPAGDNFCCCNEEKVSEPSTTSVSKGSEAEAKADFQNLNSEELPVCSKQPTPSPAACEEEEHPKTHDEEQDQQPRHPSPPLEHSPEGKPTSTSDEAATHTVTNLTLQTEDVPSDDASVVGMLSSTQAGLSSEEFDFYDELDELPTIPPWTSILMGSFFDERILLPS